MAEAARFAHHMSDEDALMWNIEKDPVLRSTILAVAILDSVPDWERLRRRIDRTTCFIPRLRQRVVSAPFRIAPPRWMAEPEFDLDFHLRRTRLSGPGTTRALLDALHPVATASFDRARPLWEFTLFEGLADPNDDGAGRERAALALKVHHSVTDGVGGMALLAHFVDLVPDASERPDDEIPAAIAPEYARMLPIMRGAVSHTRRRALGVAQRVPGSVARATGRAIRNPVGSAAEAVRTTRSVARTLAPAMGPMSTVMLGRGLGRRLEVFDVSLDQMKRVAKATEGSLNDVFVAAVVGGVRRYHERHGAAPSELRMTLPINLRQGDDEAGGNRFAPARFPVPTAIADPRERIAAVGALVREVRTEPALQMTSTLAGILNRLPTATTTALFGGMLKCCDFVTSNVPGAPVPVYVAGARVERFYAFAPPAGAAFNVALISHCDTCCIGIVIDTVAVPDPDVLLGCLHDGFNEVMALA
jgi:diacylglycerol O-acyltransferase / wax synthase